MRIEMPRDVEWIIGRIREHGFEAFAVGGCVRDTILGREPEDWDITTSARPEEIKALFLRTADTGIAHGTVTVLKSGKGYEVTTYRIDGEYRDARHPDSVEFTANLREDLKRRDFTINAMAYSHETGIVDAFGGMEDLKNGIIRCVGLPEERFLEDALRILRAVRFSAQLGFSIEEKTLEAVKTLAPNLVHVSQERIQTELTKLLLSDHPERVFLVHETGMDRYVTEGFDAAFARITGEPLFEDLSRLPAEKSLRWAGFLRGLSPKEAESVLRSLKLDNATIANAKMMIFALREPLAPDKTEIRRLLSRMTEEQFEGGLILRKLEGEPAADRLHDLYREILRDGDCVRLKDLAVGGGDLIAAGMKPGKELGEALNALLFLVLEDPKANEKEILMKYWKSGGDGPAR